MYLTYDASVLWFRLTRWQGLAMLTTCSIVLHLIPIIATCSYTRFWPESETKRHTSLVDNRAHGQFSYFNAEKQAQTLQLWIFQKASQSEVSCDPGIREPHFQIRRFELMTDWPYKVHYDFMASESSRYFMKLSMNMIYIYIYRYTHIYIHTYTHIYI